MSSAEEQSPHPEALARLFIANGDTQSALEVCASWRRRFPDESRIAQVEDEARDAPRSDAPPPLDQRLAERYLQDGYLEEAMLIYQRLAFFSDIDEQTQERINLLGNFLAFSPPVLPPDLLVKAEEQVTKRRLAVALLIYHDLASQHPELEFAETRRDQLKALLTSTSLEFRQDLNELGATVTDEADEHTPDDARASSRRRRKGFGARTRPDVNIPSHIQEAMTDNPDDSEMIDPLDDTQQMDRSEMPGLIVPNIKRASPDEDDLANALAETIRITPTPDALPANLVPPSPPPSHQDSTEDDLGRTSQSFGDPGVDDRAATGERPDASGVIVRQIHIIEG